MGSSKIVTLLTDFDYRDAYIGILKGVISKICPTAMIIDISHEVKRHSISQGAFLLSQASQYFPTGTVHLVVIDPGVGTKRRRIAIQSKNFIYVGPDNGVLYPAAWKDEIVKAVEITEKRFMLKKLSSTFEGRDVFAPIAAHLANGLKIEELGPMIYDLVKYYFPLPSLHNDTIVGEITHIDGFGNIVTNIPRGLLKQFKVIEGNFIEVSTDSISEAIKFCSTYEEAQIKSPLLIIGSSDRLEVSVNQGSAKDYLKVEVGAKLEFSIHPLKRTH